MAGKLPTGMVVCRFRIRGTRPISAAVIVRRARRQRVSVGKWCRGAGSRGILPFRFGQQPVGLPGLVAEPIRVGLAVFPGNIDHGTLATPPALVVRPVAAATSVRYARIPFVKGNFELAHGERRRDGNAVLGFRSLLRGGRTHGEFAGRYDDHRRACGGAVLEFSESTGHPPHLRRCGQTLLRRQRSQTRLRRRHERCRIGFELCDPRHQLGLGRRRAGIALGLGGDGDHRTGNNPRNAGRARTKSGCRLVSQKCADDSNVSYPAPLEGRVTLWIRLCSHESRIAPHSAA